MPCLVVSASMDVGVMTAVALPDTDPADKAPSAARVSQRDARLRRMVDAHLDFIGRVLRNAGTPAAEIDDAVQRTFIAAAQRLDDVRPGAEKSFLLQTALNVAAHARRSAARRREVPAAEPPEVVDAATPEQLTSQKRARQMLDQVLDQMEPDLRTVFVLYEFEEMSMVEIAGVIGIPQGTVASRLRRARADFRERVRALELVTTSEVRR
ncbi:RNA polymerase subunit sigma [Sorangium cellulosum]|nr:RNA polymerase subunit sigma [Sorangium cellulosum]